MAAQDCTVAQGIMTAIQTYISNWQPKGPVAISHEVRFSKVEKMHNSQCRGLAVASRPGSDAEVLFPSVIKPQLEKVEAYRHLPGQAPKGDNARKIQRWLDKVAKGDKDSMVELEDF